MEVPRIDFNDSKNRLLINPRWPTEVQNHFQNLFDQWEQSHPERKELYFVSTSGTTAKDLKQSKFVVLSKQALLRSALGVGFTFGFSKGDRVALTLPYFHVGGLSQYARAFLFEQEIIPYFEKWSAEDFFKFLNSEKITHTSLVPTQLYDLVAAGLRAPEAFQNLLIGGGFIGDELLQQAEDLGWNPQVTYGSTETASMVARREKSFYKALPHAQIRVSDDGFLEVKSPALFKGYWTGAEIMNPIQNSWFKTEDRAERTDKGIRILGRASDYAKISGEGVYLSRLQQILQDQLLKTSKQAHDASLAFVASERRGHEVHLFSIKSKNEMEDVILSFNQNVLPFERIQEFHQVSEIPKTELGKIRWQELR